MKTRPQCWKTSALENLSVGKPQRWKTSALENLSEAIAQVISFVGVVFDAFGVMIIVIGFLLATLFFISHFREATAYRSYCIRLGRTLLLSLETPVAAAFLPPFDKQVI
jgi:uncharacterized membrane protein